MLASPAQIPFCQPWNRDQYAQAVARQVHSGWFGPGPATNHLGERLQGMFGLGHCLPTVSGTVALSIAAHALGLRAGDEVLVPAYGVISTINAFAVMGLRPRLVDVDRLSGCLSPARLEESITSRTKAVCFVNFSGNTGSALTDCMEVCRAAGVPLIEDAACAMGQRGDTGWAGSLGVISTLSFSVPKIVTTGQGGVLVTKDKALFDEAVKYTDQGDLAWRKTNLNRGIGSNLRFTDLQAALALAQLDTFDEILLRKSATISILRGALSGFLFDFASDIGPLHHVIFTAERERLRALCQEAGISAAIQYRPLYEHPPYSELGSPGLFPQADWWGARALYLPFGLGMTVDQASYIVDFLAPHMDMLIPLFGGEKAE
jgi:perosamine synthetase